MSSCPNYNDMDGQRATLGLTGGSEEILLSAVRLYRMEVLLNGTLDMSRSLYLIIGYLLRDEWWT